jgi:hypothetical protein
VSYKAKSYVAHMPKSLENPGLHKQTVGSCIGSIMDGAFSVPHTSPTKTESLLLTKPALILVENIPFQTPVSVC